MPKDGKDGDKDSHASPSRSKKSASSKVLSASAGAPSSPNGSDTKKAAKGSDAKKAESPSNAEPSRPKKSSSSKDISAPSKSASQASASASPNSGPAKSRSQSTPALGTIADAAAFFRSHFTPDEAEAVLKAFYSVASPGVAAAKGSKHGTPVCVFLASKDDPLKCAKCRKAREKHGTMTRGGRIQRKDISFRMSPEDLRALAKLPDPVIANIFELFDRDGDGQIDKHEFSMFVALTTKGTASDKLSTIFRLFDEGNAGVLTKEDLTMLFQTLIATTTMLGTKEDDTQERVDALLEQSLGKRKVLTEAEFIEWAVSAPLMSMFLRHLADAWLQAPVTELSTFKRTSGDRRFRILALDGRGAFDAVEVRVLQN
jgi:Ca2+-binding EF-hand superfamily protein